MSSPAVQKEILALNAERALLHGCHQVTFARETVENPKNSPLPIQVTYSQPSGIKTTVRGFTLASGDVHARCYVSEPGAWGWEAKSATGKALSNGYFVATEASLPGKLRISREDSRQFQYANGSAFLHIGDTAHRLLDPDEKNWSSFIDQSAQAGFTKIRVTLSKSPDNLSGLYDPLRRELNLSFWDEAEKRLIYALVRHPHIQFQVNLFAFDRPELERYEEGDHLTHIAVRYALERFGSLANVHWCLASAIDPAKDSAVILQAVSRLGKALQEQSPWRSLTTCGQPRFAPFLFDGESWCDMTSLSSVGEVQGEIAQQHRPTTSKPIVVDEDRAEHAYAPLQPRYYFRRLFWSLLMSGAHPTYEGLNTALSSGSHQTGIHGYYDACHASRLKMGAHDFLHIHAFLRTLETSLEGWIPDDSIGGNKPLLVKSMRSPNSNQCILYIANPDAHEGHSGSKGAGFYSDQNAAAAEIFTTFNMDLPFDNGVARWYKPSTGSWNGEVEITKSSTTFLTPEPGDWVLWVTRR